MVAVGLIFQENIQRPKKMGYWKSTVVPKFKKLFEKNSIKKAAAAEACKAFDESKVQRRNLINRITVW